MRPHLHVSETRFPRSLRSRLAQVGLARRRCPEVQDAWLATRELGQTSSRSTPQGVLRRDPTRRTRSPRHETRRSPQLSLWRMVCSFPIGVHRPVLTRMLRRAMGSSGRSDAARRLHRGRRPQSGHGRAIHPLSRRRVGDWLASLAVDRHGGRRSLGGSGAVELRGLTLLD